MNQLYNPPGKVSAIRVKHRQRFLNYKKLFMVLAFLVSAVASKAQFQTAEDQSFPIPLISNNYGKVPNGCTDPNQPVAGRTGIVNVVDSGAVGDGQTDCTAAFRKCLSKPKQGSANIFLYIPNGTYMITDTIGFSPEYMPNPGTNRPGAGANNIQMWGQSRKGVKLVLKSGSTVFQNASAPRAFFDTGRESADRFGNSISNLTIEIQNGNPGAIGLRHYLNNYGGLYNVTIRALGPAKIGLDKSYSRANGPSLTKDVKIEGFEIGIKTDYSVESEAYEHVTLSGQTKYGWFNKRQVLTIRDLQVVNCQGAALVNESGFINILDSKLSGTGSAAIRNGSLGKLLALRVTTSGYTGFVADPEKPQQNTIAKYLSDDGVLPNGDRSSDIEPLNLAVKETPIINWETDPSKWVNVADFGATAGGQCGGPTSTDTYNPCRPCDDDAPFIQAAINSTLPGQPNAGKTHLYLPANYRIYTTIKVQGSIQRIFMPSTTSVGQPGNGRSLTDPTKRVQPSWEVLAGTGAVEFYGMITGYQSPEVFPVQPVVISSSGRTIVFKNCGFLPYGGPTIDISNGEVFIESSSIGNMRFNNVNVWARQNNPEAPNIKVDMNGGTYWGLGLKTEQNKSVVRARNRAKVEIYGAFIYDTHDSSKDIMFDLENSEMSVSLLEYFGGYGKGFGTLVKDVKAGQQTNSLLPGTESNPTYKAPWSQNNDSSLVYKPANPDGLTYNANRFGNMFLLYRNTSSDPATPSENWVIVDDNAANTTNHSIAYNPPGSTTGWSLFGISDSYLTTEHTTTNLNAEVTFQFNGDKVGFYARKANDLGQAEVRLDDNLVATVDLYSASTLANQYIYQSGDLTAGPHTLKIKAIGQKNSASSGTRIYIDAFDYRATASTTTPVTSVTINQSNPSTTVGTPITLTATVLPDNATNKTVTWTSNNTNVAINSSTGVISATQAGSATITATAGGVSGTTTVTINAASSGDSYTYVQGDKGWYWQNMTASNQDVTKTESAAIRNNSLTDQVNVPDADANGWQAAGLTWTNAKTGITKVEFYNGYINPNDPNENGTFTANVKVQYLSNGTWTDAPSGWALSSPSTYPYTNRNAGSDQTFTFTGSALPSTTGIRVVGQVHTTNESWGIYVREVKAYTGGGSTGGGSTQPPSSTAGVGYHWKNIATTTPRSDGTLNVTKFASTAVNDGNTTTSYQQIGDNTDAGLQAVGIIWPSGKTGIDKVNFYQGEITWEGGWFSPSSTQTIRVQYQTTAGGLWTDAGTGYMNQTYAYDASVSNKLYTFNIPRITQGIVGIRIIGPVKTSGDSWAIYYREVEAFASGTKVSSINDANQQLQLNQNTVAEKITVFPNPVTDGWINLGLNAADKNNKVDVLVSDLSGRVVLKNSFTSNGISERLNLSNVQPGVYMIRITGANTKFSSKVIVE
jgi:uncharacterized protein YjdB